MGKQLYPFVSEMLFRAKNHDIQKLSVVQISQLWRIEALKPDKVIGQLEALLLDQHLSTAEKLKLGFLAGYSWHEHHHPKTESLLLSAKTHISEQHVAESLLLWGYLASLYLRDHRIPMALEQLSQAFGWATNKADAEDIETLMHWTLLVFLRLNLPREALHYANAALAFSNADDNSNFQQCCNYARSTSLARLGQFTKGMDSLQLLHHKIHRGQARLNNGNQVGAIHCLAWSSFEQADCKGARQLIGLANEMNQQVHQTLFAARILVLQHDMSVTEGNSRRALEISEKLAFYQDHTHSDLDVLLHQQITAIREGGTLNSPKAIQQASVSPELRLAITRLHQNFKTCIQSLPAYQAPYRKAHA